MVTDRTKIMLMLFMYFAALFEPMFSDVVFTYRHFMCLVTAIFVAFWFSQPKGE